MEVNKVTTKVDAVFNITLNEEEARALHALTLYGTNAFLKVFYEHLGKTYLSPHEAGLRTAFKEINGLKVYLDQIHNIRQKMQQYEPNNR